MLPFSNAIYANKLYLSLFRQTHSDYLSSQDSNDKLPVIIGDVRVHPSAVIDPTAVVSKEKMIE